MRVGWWLFIPAIYSFAVGRGEGTQEQIAARFSVSLGWVEKLLRQRRRTGYIVPLVTGAEHHAAWMSPRLRRCAQSCTFNRTWRWRGCVCACAARPSQRSACQACGG